MQKTVASRSSPVATAATRISFSPSARAIFTLRNSRISPPRSVRRELFSLLPVHTAIASASLVSKLPTEGNASAPAHHKDDIVSENGSVSNELQNGGLLVNGTNGQGEGRIVPTELHKEATEAYMAYVMSVLLGRTLFAKHELGLSSKKPFKKRARVVGEVLSKFHPLEEQCLM